MAKSREEMIELIKNLLAHANDTAASPEEASAFMTKAQELLEAYNISLIEVEHVEETVIGSGIVEQRIMFVNKTWRETLARNIAYFSFARAFRFQVDKREYRMMFVGAQHNVEATILLFEWMEKRLDWLCWEETQHTGLDGGELIKHRNAWLIGAVQTITVRMSEARKERMNRETSSLVVRVKEEVEAYLRGKYVMRPRHQSSTPIDVIGYEAGLEGGKKIPLSRPIEVGKGAERLT